MAAAPMGLLGAFPVGPPLDPTAEEARRWLEEELSKPLYNSQPSLVERFIEWLSELLTLRGVGEGLPSFAATVLIFVVIVVIAWVLVRVLRREVRGDRAPGGGALDIPDLDTATLRRRARAALAAGDWDGAVLDGMRTIARHAMDRVLISDQPGRTAHEVAVSLSGQFVGWRAELHQAADAFDAVRYGDEHAIEDSAQKIIDLESSLAAATPEREAERV